MRILIVFVASLFLNGCYQKESEKIDSLVYCTENAPLSFNPQIAHDVATLDASTYQLYNRLIKTDPISQSFVADLATDWSISADKLSYTFYLRKKVQFHQSERFTPSRFFNADDVLFSFKRLLDESTAYYDLYQDSFTMPLHYLLRDIQKIDDYTVKFILKKPNATLLANLAAPYSVILSAEYAQQLSEAKDNERIDYSPIGTGPYQLKNATQALQRYEAFPRYWGKKAQIKHLIYAVTPSSTKRYTKLLSGECDVITYPAPSQLKQIGRNSQVILNSTPTENVIYLAFNTQKYPFKRLQVRKSISLAIDRQTLVKALFFQSAVITNSLLSNRSWAFNPQVKDVIYNAQESRKQLQNLNFDFKQKLIILIAKNDAAISPNFPKTAEFIQANLAEIGVNSKIISLPPRELKRRLVRADYDIYISGMNIQSNDPDSLFSSLLSCNIKVLEGNTSRWCSPETDKLLTAARLENRFTQRILNYYKLQSFVQEMRPYLAIAHVFRMDAFNINIKGLYVDPLAGINFQHVNKIKEP
ncbi:ABC transporter substrate-binding protein [Psychromonas sp. CD1]|uniref:ABC transporter substrate-binding protein n=1 Tax=Psychromonas sp. CD1 TaxID=1979839 RepID=UPI000B9BD158|nr:ABC transporter substrate-binding protein [Psychromonas sp. CD1]